MLPAGCAVGPDYVRPEPPSLTHYALAQGLAVPPGSDGGADASRVRFGEGPPRDWWRRFDSEPLNALVSRAFAGNLSLDAGRARLRRAEFLLAAEQGRAYPQFDASANAVRISTPGFGTTTTATTTPGTGVGGGVGGGTGGGAGGSGAGDIGPFVVYTVGANVQYNLDLFGRIGRSIEVRQAQLIRELADLQSTYLTLAGNIVSTAISVAAVRAQIEARDGLIAGQNERLGKIQARFKEGFSARADVVTARADVRALQATLPPLRQRLATLNHRLAELVGVAPSQLPAVAIRLDDLTFPQTIPIALPSALVRDRPDILAAEAMLAATSAGIGVATANLYPNISLSASLGGEGFKASGIPGMFGKTWSIGADLLVPLFQGGSLRARRDASIADYEEALALYRAAVLAAFRQVADGLLALQNNAAALEAQRAALADSRESLDIANFSLDEGAISVIDVLAVQQRFQEAAIATIDVRAQRLQDAAALFAALGRSPVDPEPLNGAATRLHVRKTSAALDTGVAPAALDLR